MDSRRPQPDDAAVNALQHALSELTLPWALNRPVEIIQDEPMLVHQLRNEREVIGQFEVRTFDELCSCQRLCLIQAIRGLRKWSGRGHALLSSRALRDTLQASVCFAHLTLLSNV